MAEFFAGAAVTDLTPAGSVFLAGYPHTPRLGTGIHDPLQASAVCLCDGTKAILLISCDIIYISKALAERARRRIAARSAIVANHILISATHTHSGPVTVECLIAAEDPVVPKPDAAYLALVEDRIVAAGVQAYERRRAATLWIAKAAADGIGSNRHDPNGLTDREAPVIFAKTRDGTCVAAVVVYGMHPTVLHEESTLISGDFPAMTRQYLRRNVFGEQCVVAYHTGACGDQSPRFVSRGSSVAEAQRLGELLGEAIGRVVPAAREIPVPAIRCLTTHLMLPIRVMPPVETALKELDLARGRLQDLRRKGAPAAQVRLAECDGFGAEQTLTLARAAAEDGLSKAVASCMPADVQVMAVGPLRLVAWPGEVFVEFALQVRRRYPQSFVISLANGELQGYLVTEEAVRSRRYEAGNALFSSPEAGRLLVAATLDLLNRLDVGTIGG